MIRKISLLVVALFLLVLSTSVMAQDVVELSLWTQWPGDPERSTLEAMIERFNEEHQGIRVVHRPIENEQFFTTLRTAFTSGNPPDLFQHEANNNLFQFVIPGEVADITDWFEEHQDRFIPGTEASVRYDGRYYGVPLALHTVTQIYYNAGLLEENGINPEELATWDDYLAAFQTLQDAGLIPIAYGNRAGWNGSQWFYAFLVRTVGADRVNQLIARNCEYRWTDPEIVEAAQLYVDLAEKGYFSSGMASDGYDEAQALFFSGRAAFFHTGSWFIGGARNDMPPNFELGLNTFPVVEGSMADPQNVVMGVLDGMSISRQGAEEHREEALIFLEWFTRVEQQQEFTSATARIGAVEGATTEENADPLVWQILTEQVTPNTGAIGFIEHVSPLVVGEDRIWNGSVGVLTGQLDAETWMASIEEVAAQEEPTLVLEPVCE